MPCKYSFSKIIYTSHLWPALSLPSWIVNRSLPISVTYLVRLRICKFPVARREMDVFGFPPNKEREPGLCAVPSVKDHLFRCHDKVAIGYPEQPSLHCRLGRKTPAAIWPWPPRRIRTHNVKCYIFVSNSKLWLQKKPQPWSEGVNYNFGNAQVPSVMLAEKSPYPLMAIHCLTMIQCRLLKLQLLSTRPSCLRWVLSVLPNFRQIYPRLKLKRRLAAIFKRPISWRRCNRIIIKIHCCPWLWLLGENLKWFTISRSRGKQDTI